MKTTQVSSPSNYDMYAGGNFFSPRINSSVARTLPINIGSASRIRSQAQLETQSYSFESPFKQKIDLKQSEKLFQLLMGQVIKLKREALLEISLPRSNGNNLTFSSTDEKSHNLKQSNHSAIKYCDEKIESLRNLQDINRFSTIHSVEPEQTKNISALESQKQGLTILSDKITRILYKRVFQIMRNSLILNKKFKQFIQNIKRVKQIREAEFLIKLRIISQERKVFSLLKRKYGSTNHLVQVLNIRVKAIQKLVFAELKNKNQSAKHLLTPQSLPSKSSKNVNFKQLNLHGLNFKQSTFKEVSESLKRTPRRSILLSASNLNTDTFTQSFMSELKVKQQPATSPTQNKGQAPLQRQQSLGQQISQKKSQTTNMIEKVHQILNDPTRLYDLKYFRKEASVRLQPKITSKDPNRRHNRRHGSFKEQVEAQSTKEFKQEFTLYLSLAVIFSIILSVVIAFSI